MKKSVTSVFEATIKSFIKFIDKTASKKFFAWVVATHMTYLLLLDPQSWVFITLLYLGIQGGLDWKGMPPTTITAARTIKPEETTEPIE